MYPTSFPALRDKPFSAVEVMLDVKLEFLDAMRTFTEKIGWFCKIFHYCEKTNMKNMIRIVHTFFCKQLFFFGQVLDCLNKRNKASSCLGCC